MPAILDGTLFSVVLCVMAGIALRYALFYGRQQNTEGQKLAPADEKSQDREWQERTRTLHSALEKEQQITRQLREELTRRATELSMAQQLCLDLRRGNEHHQDQTVARNDQLRELEQELRNYREANHDWESKLAEERQRCQHEQHQRQGLLAQLEQSTNTISQLRQGQSLIPELQASLEQSERDRTGFQARMDELSEQLTEESGMRSLAEANLRDAQEQIARLTADSRFAGNLRGQHAELQAYLHEVRDRNQLLTEECRHHQARVEVAQAREEQGELQLREKELQVHALGQQIQELQALLDKEHQSLAESRVREADLHQARDLAESKRHEIQHEVATLQRQLTSLYADLDALRKALADADQLKSAFAIKEREFALLQELAHDLRQERDEYADGSRKLDESLRRLQRQVRDLSLEKEQILHGLHRETEQESGFETDLREHREQLAELKTQLTEFDDLQTRYRQGNTQLKENQARLNRVSEDCEAARQNLAHARQRSAELEQEVGRLSNRLERQESLSRELRIEREEALTYLEREKNERSALERRLRIDTESLDRLKDDSRVLESLLEKQSAVQLSLHEHAERLRATATEDDGNETSRGLDPRPRTASPLILTFGERFERSSPHISAISETGESLLARSGSSKADLTQDDLKRIVGIGEVLESRLWALGFCRFEQIMNWSDEEVQAVSRVLGFRDRIQREQWVSQAQRLFQERRMAAA